ncbi:kanadaptin isoform X2 [Dendroctonus ponderosae]|uniref:FHA domain-containing protein n=1 Tax=Dendroctonus ponderosae TaxID=77166 RepID=A0AAR5Q6H8_DENPD|nr:kanadaptin isoform X2 [Dendroctonus ponderosae]
MEKGPEHDNKPKEPEAAASTESKDISFKKPTLLIGKVGRLPKKVDSVGFSGPPQSSPVDYVLNTTEENPKDENNIKSSDKRLNPKSTQGGLELLMPVLPYTEPAWSGLPETTGKNYVLEVLKEGKIIDYIDLMKKPFWVFGRMTNCDVLKEHPSVSRYHVLLQYRKDPSESEPQGFYLYDLSSTHGTFVNGRNKLKPKTYMRYRVGHVFRVGTSKRHYILTGPETDQEEESELTITELKQLKAQKLKEIEDRLKQREIERHLKIKQEEDRGIDWGMGEEANDEDEIAENPFASTNNEELYLDDPKKALRGFFEREGLNLDYDCTEQGMGQFLCKVELPLDDEMGRPLMAEVLHRGKKKEAVVQCALEACRILDRAGILRQATHESRKRKTKDWEENDFYDSDEDTFLDRTGTIEKKREKRMKVKQPDKAQTYESLVQKEKDLTASIADIEKKLGEAQISADASSDNNTEEDSLDSYMKGLSDDKLDKQTVSKLKLELTNLRKERANIIRLANLAKPADMPSFSPAATSTTADNKGKKLPIFGKRKIVPVKYPAKVHQQPLEDTPTTSEGAEEESDEETTEAAPTSPAESPEDLDEQMPIHCFHKLQQLRSLIPDASGKYKPVFLKILHKSHRMAISLGRADSDWKVLSTKLKKIMKWTTELQQNQSNGKRQHMITTELGHILADLNHMEDEKFKTFDMAKGSGHTLKNISMQIDKDLEELKENSSENAPAAESRLSEEINEPDTREEEPADDQADKKKKKNLKRIEHRTHRAEMEKQKGYVEDASKEDYNMWVPPTDQSGDGRTKLNEKFGY